MPFDDRLLCFTNCSLVLEDGSLHVKDLWIDVESGTIVDSQHAFFTQRRRPGTTVNLGGNILSPGLIDVQINGAYGIDFSIYEGDDAKYEAGLERVATKIVETGVTSLVPTVITQEKSLYPTLLGLLRSRNYPDGANLLGWHAEGPFLQPAKKGAHAQHFLLTAENGIATFDDVYGPKNLVPRANLPDKIPEPFIRMITAAPELTGVSDSISELVTGRGIVFSIGHSIANSEIATRAVAYGANMVTHLFNAMPQLHHRDPAIIGLLGMSTSYSMKPFKRHSKPGKFPSMDTEAHPLRHAPSTQAETIPSEALSEVLTPPTTPYFASPAVGPLRPNPKVPPIAIQKPYYGIIVDGIHSHPHSVRLAYSSHPSGCVLITDAMSMLDPHLPDGVHEWRDGRPLTKEGDKLTLTGTDTLAGSVVTLDKCVRNFSHFTGTPLATSIVCATLHPAKCLGIEARKGTLRPGADADLAVWDHEGNVVATWVRGKQVWAKECFRRT